MRRQIRQSSVSTSSSLAATSMVRYVLKTGLILTSRRGFFQDTVARDLREKGNCCEIKRQDRNDRPVPILCLVQKCTGRMYAEGAGSMARKEALFPVSQL
jgi:hypothetical protein